MSSMHITRWLESEKFVIGVIHGQVLYVVFNDSQHVCKSCRLKIAEEVKVKIKNKKSNVSELS